MPTSFSRTSPSPILADFHLLLDTISATPALLTPRQNFARKWLFEINPKMSSPQSGMTEKTDQKYYPLLHLFYWICLESGICTIKESGKTATFQPNVDKINIFRQLSPEAQYFFLLETYLTRLDWGALNDYPSFVAAGQLSMDLPQVAKAKVGQKISIQYPGSFSHLSVSLGYHGLYFQYFGLWNIELDANPKDYPKTFYRYKTIILSDWGKLFLQKIVDEKLHTYEAINNMEEGDVLSTDPEENTFLKLPKRLHEYFVNDFPAGVFFGMPVIVESIESMEGNYIFKVSLKDASSIWRRIVLSHEDNLEMLHNMIQKAFNFDNDHLFAFYLNLRNDRRDVYFGPSMYSDEAPFACDAIIGELGFTAGRKFRYLFDFGDYWQFDIALEMIETDKKPLKQAAILERHGKAPKQYRNGY